MGWLSGWNRRKSHTIEGSTAGAQTNYQMKIVAYKSSGTDSGENVYLGTNVRDDFGDVRFTKADGTTLLDYWMESYISGTKATFWVEVDSIPASPDSVDIYIYYDKPDATTTSNGDNTFLFFDHFPGTSLDTSKWETYPGSDVSVSDSVVRIGGGTVVDPPNYGQIRSIGLTFPVNRKIRAKAKQNATTDYSFICFEYDWYNVDIFKDACLGFIGDGNLKGQLRNVTAELATIGAYSANIYYVGTVKRKSDGSILVSVDGLTEVSLSTYVWTDNGYLELAKWRGDAGYLYGDWVFVAKYVDPEPSHGVWGSEETVVVVVVEHPLICRTSVAPIIVAKPVIR